MAGPAPAGGSDAELFFESGREVECELKPDR